jgi:hypothetical protein
MALRPRLTTGVPLSRTQDANEKRVIRDKTTIGQVFPDARNSRIISKKITVTIGAMASPKRQRGESVQNPKSRSWFSEAPTHERLYLIFQCDYYRNVD